MPEYLGYKGSAPVDFAGITRQGMSDVIGSRDAARASTVKSDALKKQNDNKYDESYNEFLKEMEGSVSVSPDKQFTDLVFEAADAGRNMQQEINTLVKSGDIPASVAKNIYGKMSSQLGQWSVYKTNVEEIAKIQTKRLQEGESSVLEQEDAVWRGEMMNFNNKNAAWTPEGDLLFQTLNEEGEVTGSQNANQLVGQVQNFAVNKHELNEVTLDIAKSGGAYKYVQGLTTISDPTAHKDYPDWIRKQIRAATNRGDAKTVAAIVLDNNLEYEYQMTTGDKEAVSLYSRLYYDDNQKNTRVEEQLQEVMEDAGREFSEEEQVEIRSEIEGLMIPVRGDGSGKGRYAVNSKHKDMVENAIKKDVSFKLGYSEAKRAPKAKTGSGGDDYINGYNATLNAFSSSDFSGLNTNYVYMKSGKGVAVYNRFRADGFDLTDNIIKAAGKSYTPKAIAMSAKDLAVYTYGGSTNSAMNKWDADEKKSGRGKETGELD